MAQKPKLWFYFYTQYFPICETHSKLHTGDKIEKKKIKNLAPVWTPVPNWVLESGGQLSRLTRTTLEWWLTKIYINKPSQQMVLCGGHVNCLINNLADSLWCFGRHKRTLQRQFSSIKMLFSQHLFFFKNLLICRLKNRIIKKKYSNETKSIFIRWI